MRDQASWGPFIFEIEIAIQNNVTSRHQQTKLPPCLNESQGEGSRFNHTKNENESHYMSTNISKSGL